ncbi:hypothetical protein K2173_020681 [Erythroxylum novogranatense]|uniref:Aluminum-activated malate transporter n=1 Tax=Erythroxylum novogranatense TaxID=1862640 RepID=A0AAV8TLH1_9ROSI|nr:hypothetical protein K2173_020681 [Erythroxylum novogranatense]
MKLEASRNESETLFARGWSWFKSLPENLKAKVIDIVSKTKKVGRDDPRRIIHSLKVGFAVTLVSTIYYYQPLYKNFGDSALWAVMTVVVVFEFSVGATLGKGLNRAMATFLACALGIGAHYIANSSGHIGEPILIGFFVFLQASISTFIRFFPNIKARYDYGLLIFILTFSFISISGLRVDEVLQMAHKRLSTIILGGFACLMISIVVFPVWAGEDLHNLIALNTEKLGKFLEGFGDEYFKVEEDGKSEDDKSFLHGYRSVLNSKSAEESLANFARWEPGHGRFQFRHPWKQYLKVGTLVRQCAYRIEALSGCLLADKQVSPEVKSKIQEACTKVSVESGQALKELALSVNTMVLPYSADPHIQKAKSAARDLKSLLRSSDWEGVELQQVIPAITVASLLLDAVTTTEIIAESIHELATAADFEKVGPTVSPEKLPKQLHPLKSESDVDCPHVVIEVKETSFTSVREK